MRSIVTKPPPTFWGGGGCIGDHAYHRACPGSAKGCGGCHKPWGAGGVGGVVFTPRLSRLLSAPSAPRWKPPASEHPRWCFPSRGRISRWCSEPSHCSCLQTPAPAYEGMVSAEVRVRLFTSLEKNPFFRSFFLRFCAWGMGMTSLSAWSWVKELTRSE